MQLIFQKRIARLQILDQYIYRSHQFSSQNQVYQNHSTLSYMKILKIPHTKIFSNTNHQKKKFSSSNTPFRQGQDTGPIYLNWQKMRSYALGDAQKNRIQAKLFQSIKYFSSYYRQPRQQKKLNEKNMPKEKEKQKDKDKEEEEEKEKEKEKQKQKQKEEQKQKQKQKEKEKEKEKTRQYVQKVEKIESTKIEPPNMIGDNNFNKYLSSNFMDSKRKKWENSEVDHLVCYNFTDKTLKIQERIFNYIDYLVKKIGSQFSNYELYFNEPDTKAKNKINLQEVRQEKLENQKIHLDGLLDSKQFKKLMDEKIGKQKLELYFKFLQKIKIESINQTNINFYSIMSKVCEIFQKKFLVRENYLSTMISKLVETHKIQEIQRIESKNQNHQQSMRQDEDGLDKLKAKNEQNSFKKNKTKISILELSMLIYHMKLIPKQYHGTLIKIIIKNIELLNETTIGVFLADSIVQKRDIQKQKLVQLYHKIDEINLQFSLRYIYLLFIKENMNQKIMPMYQIIGRVNRFEVQNNLMEDLYKYAKLISLQLEIIKKSVFYQFFTIIRKLMTIDRSINEYRYFINFNLVVRVYNLIAKQYPIGTLFIGYYRDLVQLKKQYLFEYKKLIRFLMVNFNSRFIYSVGEHSINEMNNSIMNLMDTIIKFIIANDPKFLLEVCKFYQKYQSTNEKKNWTGDIQSIIKQMERGEINLEYVFSHNHPEQVRKDQTEDLLKLINFIYKNHDGVSLIKIKQFIVQIFNKIMDVRTSEEKQGKEKHKIIDIQKIPQQSWKLLYQISNILDKIDMIQSQFKNFRNKSKEEMQDSNENQDDDQKSFNKQQNVIKIIEKFVCPYIKKSIQNKKQRKILNTSKRYEEYILRIISLLRKQNFKNLKKDAFQKQVIKFINSNFIYSVKSVIKRGIFQILGLFKVLATVFDKKPEYQIDPQIYAYLYGNLSSFIVYIEKTKKLFLTRGKKYEYQKQYQKILLNAIQNYRILKNIENKDRLNVLNILLYVFWKKVKPKQIAQYLIIINDPMLLDERLKKKFESVVFTNQDIKNLDLKILSKYRLINESLRELVNNFEIVSGNNRLINGNYKLNNSRTVDEIRILFQLNEFFQIAIENKQFTNQHLLPQPLANSDNRTKMIYACLKIIYKIRNQRDFSLKGLLDVNKKKNNRFNPIDLSQEIGYIQKENLIKLHDINQFKLDNIEASGHNQMIQCWNYHYQSDKFIEISNFSTFGLRDIDLYQKLLLVVKGNTGIIQNLLKRQSSRGDLIEKLSQLGLDVSNNGSLIEIEMKIKRKIESDQENEGEFGNQNQEIEGFKKKKKIYFLCSNNSNHKIHLIYAYVLSQVGYKVYQVDQNDNFQLIKNLIEKQLEKQLEKQNDISGFKYSDN